MRGIIVAAALAAALALAGSASAASINECDTVARAANGYQSLVNITSRNVTCSQARHVAFVIYREVGPDNEGNSVCAQSCVVRWAGWRISVRYGGPGPGYADVRATASRGRVVHFQALGK